MLDPAVRGLVELLMSSIAHQWYVYQLGCRLAVDECLQRKADEGGIPSRLSTESAAR